jgi:group II intron reverse transcriptase/maturase
MEQRRPQKLNRKHKSQIGRRAERKFEINSRPEDFKLELQNNSWLRIGLTAKNTELVFNNLFCHFNLENLREAFHALDGTKAVGIDGMTKEKYGRGLERNLNDLLKRLHKGTYRPLPKRGTEIPKANGQMRPLAIASFEDKIVEWVLAKLLSTIHEPIFIKHSYGFRPKRSTLDAIKVFFCSLKDNKRPHVVEIDFTSFFNTVPHKRLLKMVSKRVSDRRIISLIARLLQVGIMEKTGDIKQNEVGTPQGAIVSPVLANIYLHYALDVWFMKEYAPHGAVMTRYADDAVFCFELEGDAKAFNHALRERMNGYKLSLNEEKSKTVNFHKKLKQVFSFLGFTFYWGKDRGSQAKLLKVKTEQKRLDKKVVEYSAWVKENRARMTTAELWEATNAKLRGHYQAFGVYGNRPRLYSFFYKVVAQLFRWLNRRSQKRSYTWAGFKMRMKQHPLLAPPGMDRLKQLVDRRIYV